MSIIMYIICIVLCDCIGYYVKSYLWHVLIDDEHQILERHYLTCHNHRSTIEQILDTWILALYK